MPQPTGWDIFLQVVDLVANGASILTAVIAVLIWGKLKTDDAGRISKLEAYLEGEKGSGDNGQRTALHLKANLGMTEEQIFAAALKSENIRMIPGKDDRGRADSIWFEYTTGNAERDLELEGAMPSRRRRK